MTAVSTATGTLRPRANRVLVDSDDQDGKSDSGQPSYHEPGSQEARDPARVRAQARLIVDRVEDAAHLRLCDERRCEGADEEHPSAADRDFGSRSTGDEPRREEQRAEPARRRHPGHEPQAADLPLTGLTHEFEPQCAVGAGALGLELFAFEFETPRVAVE